MGMIRELMQRSVFGSVVEEGEVRCWMAILRNYKVVSGFGSIQIACGFV